MTASKFVKKFFKSFLLSLFAIGSFVFAFWYGLGLVSALDTVSIFYDPISLSLPPDGTVSLKLDSQNENVGFVAMEIEFDNTKVNLSQEIVTNSFFTPVDVSTMSEANLNGRIRIDLGLSPDYSATPPNGVFEVAQLQFTSVTGQENDVTSLNLDQNSVQIVNLDAQVLPFNYEGPVINLNTTDPTPTLTTTPIPTLAPSGVTLSLTGSNTGFVGEENSMELNLSADQEVSGVDAVINFDPNLYEVNSATASSLLSDTSFVNIDNTSGVIDFSQLAEVGASFSGTGVLATISYTPLVAGAGSFAFEFTSGATTDSNVVSFFSGQDILSQVQNLSINTIDRSYISVSLQTPAGEHDVTGEVYSDGFTSPFTTDVAGDSGQIELPYTFFGGTYDFFVKVPGYLRVKRNLAISGGNILFDAGDLVAGDLNDDGIINTLDLSLMYSVWGIVDPNNALSVTANYYDSIDANGDADNKVNSLDHWILTSNFFRIDE